MNDCSLAEEGDPSRNRKDPALWGKICLFFLLSDCQGSRRIRFLSKEEKSICLQGLADTGMDFRETVLPVGVKGFWVGDLEDAFPYDVIRGEAVVC